ncbi:natural cytotoxicity triggering receptor 3-like [Lithobates pipiens]
MIPIIGLFFILGALPGFQTQRIEVSQDPKIVASEGNSVTLPCTYRINTRDNPTVGYYKWYRHDVRAGAVVSDNTKDFHGRVSTANVDRFIHDRSAPLKLHQLVQSDTGLYYCEVTLQLNGGISGHGNGTFLIVTAKKMPSYAVLNILKITLLVLFLLVAIALSCYLKGYSMRRRHDNCSSFNIHPSLPSKDVTSSGGAS